MPNFGKLSNEELISLLSATKDGIEDGDDKQIGTWNRLFNKASEQIEERLDDQKIVNYKS